MKKYSIIVVLILFVCSTYLWAQKKQVHKGKATASHKSAAAAGSTSASIAAGKKVYMQYCISCHQADGGGVQNMNPPLIKTQYVLGDKSKLVSILQNGFNENVEINGDTYSNAMPSFSFLKNPDIANVLTFVRNSFGNKASAVTLKEVSAIRPTVTNKK